MSDWIGLGIFLLLIILALVASAQLGKPRKKISVEEFEERARSGGGAAAGMFGLQKLLNPGAVKAIEVQQDLKSGYYNKKKVPGEGDDEEETGAGEPGGAGAPDARPAGGGSKSEGGEERDA
ncbi:MAG TPA: hypothetical protein VM864_08935 [Pyrinomonadaceae bacterium]|jgi:hypothetical protein|nr:hypothetical protein [Pyrinomonadaceae bacterium]